MNHRLKGTRVMGSTLESHKYLLVVAEKELTLKVLSERRVVPYFTGTRRLRQLLHSQRPVRRLYRSGHTCTLLKLTTSLTLRAAVPCCYWTFATCTHYSCLSWNYHVLCLAAGFECIRDPCRLQTGRDHSIFRAPQMYHYLQFHALLVTKH